MCSKEKCYIAIDLKSFYASVECVERGRDPLKTNLVVADASRTEKTICLAVSPSLKEYGIPGRARLFEVIQKVREANSRRKSGNSSYKLEGETDDAEKLKSDNSLAISYIIAAPRMSLYMSYSIRIYQIYLKYFSAEDIHVYSIDEVFIDATDYLETYQLSPQKLTEKIIGDVLKETGITATAGIGTNLYLCKIAMDIVAKHMPADKNGARIAQLDEMTYRTKLWNHKPITDFWRVGKGYAKKLSEKGMYTMGDIARCSLGAETDFYNEDLLYRLFGVNAELLIDHAWGVEPCTIADIKAYRPDSKSLSSGQVLSCPYSFEKAKLIVKEMTDLLVLDIVEKEMMTNQMVLTIEYDIDNLKKREIREKYHGEMTTDHYGRKIPKHAHGTKNLKSYTSSTQEILKAVMMLYEEIVDENLLVRKIYVVANNLISEKEKIRETEYRQLNLFEDLQENDKKNEKEKNNLEREKRIQKTVIEIKNKYGKNAIIKGMNLQEGATTISRNNQIGGHKA